MPYKPTGRPNGRPRKEFAPPPPRAFVSATAPVPYQEPADTSPPQLGQRKRVKNRRPGLRPTPLKA